MTTQIEMIALLKLEVKGLTSYLADVDYTNATNDAARDTGWAFPVTVDFKIYWQKQRSKRHLYEYLQSESAHKFKYEQINLQHRFAHYSSLIKNMDTAFEKIQEERPDQFADVDALHMFGTHISPGFAYVPQTGVDITYNSDQTVDFGPKEDD